MRIQPFLLMALLSACAIGSAQSQPSPPIQIYGEYSWLSNSLNGVPGAHQSLNGFNAGVAFPRWHHLRFKLDYSMYRGVNLGDPQHPYFIQGGGQYEGSIGRERFYAEALVGEGGANGTWFSTHTAGYQNGNPGSLASLGEFLGGGADTPMGSRIAFRIEGGVQHSNFVPVSPLPKGQPYHLDGIPNYFGRLSAGIVWIPRPGSSSLDAPKTPPESDLIFETINSIGHFHLYADSWWSYLYMGGVEYDRNSWGRFIGARFDYSGEILPVDILRQPSKTNYWGQPLRQSTTEIAPGIGILPLGFRLLWRDHTRFKPYYVVKSGMTGYSKKAFSHNDSYEVFSLDQSIGFQFRLNDHADFRTGMGMFHQSNGFVVPGNAGLDATEWNAGLAWHLNRGPAVR